MTYYFFVEYYYVFVLYLITFLYSSEIVQMRLVLEKNKYVRLVTHQLGPILRRAILIPPVCKLLMSPPQHQQ